MQSAWIEKPQFGKAFKLLISLFIISVISVGSLTIWVNWSLSAPSSDGSKKIFVIKSEESVSSFSKRLGEENLIRNAFMFNLYLKLSGLDRKIQAGSFSLPKNLAAEELAKELTEGRLDKWITFVEGLRKEQVAEILSQNFDIDKQNFLESVKEGYLFPDTYLIPIKASEKQIISIFDKTFSEKVTPDIILEAEKKGLNKDQMINLASIVERETRNQQERPIVAGILIKRWKEGMLLAADATVQYALGYSSEEKNWWRKNITAQDLEFSSPYNTRLNVGLPPGPICSPSLASIKAVVEATESPYYFYLHNKNGNIYYSKTYEEHLQKVNQYLGD
ncbi:MAG: hypothetical protein A2172_01315 [Candidatus Woykebacteria bacterium RBG_13_40_15]|uniref:Endolytic murein transglycosylase n=1 Tax=Candidatus Woykebacteria bacterium RBG_13_40_15 TaxID=1802593 RepID=A0A1G1W909_9BACT|nr:MAG: hypothetical protein A2172_01315 [Candidatus Woykebacteria bacterium RBG_13_40_15]